MQQHTQHYASCSSWRHHCWEYTWALRTCAAALQASLSSLSCLYVCHVWCQRTRTFARLKQALCVCCQCRSTAAGRASAGPQQQQQLAAGRLAAADISRASSLPGRVLCVVQQQQLRAMSGVCSRTLQSVADMTWAAAVLEAGYRLVLGLCNHSSSGVCTAAAAAVAPLAR